MAEHMMMRLALLVCLAHQCLAGQTFMKAAVKVMFPTGYKSRAMPMSLADFGIPKFGASLVGNLVYPSEDIQYNPTGKRMRCSDIPCQYGCQPFADARPPFSITKQPGRHTIMLLDRGPKEYDQPCYFLTKAYNAQQAGADALLVVDDTPGEVAMAVVPDEEAVASLLDSLTISTAVISMEDGAFLKSLLQDQTPVTLALNWTSVMPRADKVSWELWSSINGEAECGVLCSEQRRFVHAIKPVAQMLERSGAVSFTPHYLLWSCPERYIDSEECVNECIHQGSYCVPDPDGSFTEGLRGQDVLAQHVRQLCLWKVANASGVPWQWWDYVDWFGSNCTIASGNYNANCSQMAFAAAGGPLLAQGHGQAEWDACVASVLSPPSGSNTTRLPLLEAELNAQQGSGDEPDVSALPTVRVNGRQYRGTLEATSVVRALCSAFPRGQEPAVCNEASVSEDECLPGGPGYAQCRVGDAATAGHTRCVNTFESYRCECGQGWVKSVKADTGEEVCEDLNECLVTNVASSDPACSCPRCACVNLPGSFRCTGELPNKCNASYDYGGCWRTMVEGRVVHACRDTLQDYQRLAARGRLQDTDDWFTCQCPGCFQPVSGVPTNLVCEPQCPWAQCQEQGRGGGGPVCQQPEAGPGPAGAGSPGQGGGMSGGAVVTVALLSMGCTLVALAALYQYVLRDRMQAEVRDAMQQYMPLGQASRRPPPLPPSGPGLPGYDPDEEAAPLLSTLPLTAGPFSSSSPAGSTRPGLPPPRPVPLAPGSAAGEAAGGSGPDKAFRRTAFGSLITITADSSSSSSLAGRGEAALGLLPSRLRAGSGEGGSEELGGGGYQAPPLTLSPSEGGLEGGQGATPAGRGAGAGGPLGVGLPGPL